MRRGAKAACLLELRPMLILHYHREVAENGFVARPKDYWVDNPTSLSGHSTIGYVKITRYLSGLLAARRTFGQRCLAIQADNQTIGIPLKSGRFGCRTPSPHGASA